MTAARALSIVLIALVAPGCSLILDASQFRHDSGPALHPDAAPTDAAPKDAHVGHDGGMRDGPSDLDSADQDALPQPDSGVDAGPLADAMPGLDATSNSDATPVDAGPPVQLATLMPADVDEGQGGSANGPGVPLLLEGSAFTADSAISFSDPGLHADPPLVSADGTWLAVALHIAVDTALATGATKMVTVTVSHGMSSAQLALTVHGLDELALTSSGTVPAGGFAARYSRVNISPQVSLHLSGAAAARLVATEDVVVDGVLSADGLPDGTAGPGSCAGGSAQAAALCSSGGSAG
jgi:hypothetical protein